MKLSRGFTRLLPTLLMFIFYGCGINYDESCKFAEWIYLLFYAVWSGLGTAAIALIGILWFHEPATALRSFRSY
jgi:small multidrug resistance pump